MGKEAKVVEAQGKSVIFLWIWTSVEVEDEEDNGDELRRWRKIVWAKCWGVGLKRLKREEGDWGPNLVPNPPTFLDISALPTWAPNANGKSIKKEYGEVHIGKACVLMTFPYFSAPLSKKEIILRKLLPPKTKPLPFCRNNFIPTLNYKTLAKPLSKSSFCPCCSLLNIWSCPRARFHSFPLSQLKYLHFILEGRKNRLCLVDKYCHWHTVFSQNTPHFSAHTVYTLQNLKMWIKNLAKA